MTTDTSIRSVGQNRRTDATRATIRAVRAR